MTVSQLATRMGIAQPNASRLEKSEGDGGATLKSIRRAAEAMDCQFVYFFVPHQGSFEALLEKRIRAAAKRELERLKHTMALEAQGVQGNEEEELLNQLVQQIASNPSEIWNEAEEPHEHP
jgi:predicted DNA-binding mobile mystery protein A